jgi:hypothetical protein
MAEREQEQKLDELLDSMLAAYSAAEPRPGLETRIVANLREQGGQDEARWWSRRWLWAGASMAAIAASVVLVILFSRATGPKPSAPMQAARQQTTPSQIAQSPTVVMGRAQGRTASGTVPGERAARRPRVRQTKASMQNTHPAPWPAMFPTPLPLTQQERLMFAYIENTPREEVIAQLVRDEQKEIDAFWEDRAPSSGAQRLGNTR